MSINKLVIKTSVAAVAAVFAGSAFAAVDYNANTGAVKFASELTYNNATPLVGAAGDTDLTGLLGFGVSAGATRYIRISYGNAVLDGTAGALDVAGDAGVIVQGGAAGDNYVIYQFTAIADRDQNAAVTIAGPIAGFRVTSTGAPVTVSYKLHETAVDAVNGTNPLSSAPANLATFAPGLVYTVTTGSRTATVADAFKLFGGAVAPETTSRVELGQVNYSADATAMKHDGAAVTLAQLVAATTNIVVTGDFGAADTVVDGGISLDPDGVCNNDGDEVAGVLNPGKTSATITVDTTEYATGAICYMVTGAAAIPAQTVNQTLDLTAAAGSSVSDTAAAKLGDILHDGAQTIALNVTSPDNADQTYVRISNVSGTAHGKVTGTLYAQDGSMIGAEDTLLVADLLARQTEVLSAAQLATKFGVTTWTGRAKLVIVAEIPASALRVQNMIRTANGTLVNVGGDTSTNNN